MHSFGQNVILAHYLKQRAKEINNRKAKRFNISVMLTDLIIMNVDKLNNLSHFTNS